MKFGVREICDVVLKAKATQKVGDKTFYRGEPVIYFDTLKTSTLEGAATTVYAQGGAGNARLMAWDGERTVTFTMEDALISPEGLMVLSGAGLIKAGQKNAAGEVQTIKQHMTEIIPAGEKTAKVTEDNKLEVTLGNVPYVPADYATGITNWDENYIYVMLMRDGEIISEPFIPDQSVSLEGKKVTVQPTKKIAGLAENTYALNTHPYDTTKVGTGKVFPAFDSVLVDYYVEKKTYGSAQQINITPDKFGGNYYLEASTLFRDTDGLDHPAEFIIPNCKVQSNFTFTMASSGDPSTFTFTMDAFPDYTKFDKTEKVLASIQIIDSNSEDEMRIATYHNKDYASPGKSVLDTGKV